MDSNSAPLLGRCKACDYAIFATREDVKPADNLNEVKAGAGAYRVNNGVVARCTNGHRVFPLKAVKGTYSEAHQCDARCLNAKGHNCTCSCGGANHGRGHAVAVVEASTITAPVEDPATDKQINFINVLVDRLNLRNDKVQEKLDAGLTKKQASAWITRLKEIEDNA